MKEHRVVYRREAMAQLSDLHRYIGEAGSPENATRFVDAIVNYCEGLANFPRRGTARDNIRPGLRTVSFRKRVVIAFAVLNDTVAILGIYYGGRDYENILLDEIAD